LGLLEHPRPQQVLLLGGGVAGLGPEILKTRTVTQLTYVELDPYLVRLAQGLLPAMADLSRDPRVLLIYQDARRFLETTPHRYDVILMALPEPKSAQLNRFYTREFYRLVAGKLTPGGVFSFALPGAETSLSPLRAAYLAMGYHTLGQVFPEVAVFPGARVQFFAASRPGIHTADPELLADRIRARHLPLQYVREYYLGDELLAAKVDRLRQILEQDAWC
jgi:spermidine synthase